LKLLVDSSAWIDYFRGADTRARAGVRKLLLADPIKVVTAEPIATGCRPDHIVLALTGTTPAVARNPV